MRPRILLIGADGQVAWELRRTLGCLGELFVANRSAGPHVVDLADPRTIAAVVSAVRPDWIVNAAAYTAVDKAESEAELAMRVNAEAVGLLAQEAARQGASLVHYSTDYVFDGGAERPYTEQDATAPAGVHGRSKLAGEQHIAAAGVPHIILRTSWVYGARGQNFLRTMRRLAREREELGVVADQFGAPTWSRHIAQATAQILAQLQQDRRAWQEATGIYHLTAAGQCSWYDFASRIIAHQRQHEAVAVRSIKPLRTDQYPTAATRPAYSVLDTSKVANTFGVYMPDWSVGVDLVLEELGS